MAEFNHNPLVSIKEAYWWLNGPDAPYLRPPLHEFLEQFCEAEKANDHQAAELICLQFMDSQLDYLRPPLKEMVEKLYHAVKIWLARDIEAAREKLRHSGGSYLRNPNYAYVLKMREAVSRDPANAWVPLDRLYTMRDQSNDDLEAGETLVECAFALYKLQNPRRALQVLQEANRRYNSYSHQIAVVYWMIGSIHLELGQQNKALQAWRRSANRFDQLAAQRITQASSETKWYREVLQKLNASIEYAVEHEKDTLVPAAAETQVATSTTASPVQAEAEAQENDATESMAVLPEAQPIITYSGDLLEALPVLAEIPAGPWKQTRGDRNIIGQVTIEQVLINNAPHFVKNLRGGHIINLASIEKHVVIKIIGDSMNASHPTPIEDGDYVLLRRQNTAQAGDIVVAKIFDKATSSPLTTIKRFLIDGHPLLQAESTDPKYGQLDDEFKIDGLAVAVFKPVFKKDKTDGEPL